MIVLTPDGQLGEKPPADPNWPFFRLAFRPFFWLGALFSIISIMVWALSFTGNILFMPYGSGYFWHVHEMLFGFAVAIIAGFLLTAVQTWTKQPSVKGIPLAILVGIWLVARILMAFPDLVPAPIIAAIDLAFLPLAAFFLALPIVKAQMWRNLFFVPVLLIMAILNALMHGSVAGIFDISYVDLSHVMVMMITLVMCVMGGRVFPMFTANGTRTQKVQPIAWLEKVAIISVIASVVVSTNILSGVPALEALIYLIAGVSNFIRALRWRIWVTFGTPLVWTLHVSYWSICIGLILLAAAEMQWLNNASIAFHTITVGGMGMMILAMISRVSLGHTGRFIEVGKIMTMAFIVMVLGIITRALAPAFMADYTIVLLASAILWLIAYGTFVIMYAPVLFKPRVDGSPG